MNIVVAILTVSIATAAAADLPKYHRINSLPEPRQIQDAELTDQNGEPYRLSQLQGKAALIFFGFTNCPDVCPITMSRWREFESSAGDDILENLEFVLISVDGERDTPEVIKEYLGNFSKNFIGLTGDPKAVKPIAKQFRAAFYKENPEAHGGHYNVTHSPQSYVLDQNGDIRAEFYNPAVSDMAGFFEALLAATEKSTAE